MLGVLSQKTEEVLRKCSEIAPASCSLVVVSPPRSPTGYHPPGFTHPAAIVLRVSSDANDLNSFCALKQTRTPTGAPGVRYKSL